MKYRASIIACARWETQYICEWLAYHRSIGFEHVYLYCNDDDPRDLYEQVLPYCQGEPPFVTFQHFPFQGQQFHMYMHCLRKHKDESEWVIFLDIDEFLCLRNVNDINRFLDGCPDDWDCVQFNWLFFGHNGYHERPPGSVLKNYTRREKRIHQTTKTLTRTQKIDLRRIDHLIYIWHNWTEVFGAGFKAVNVLGEPAEEILARKGERYYPGSDANQKALYDTAVVHHYAFKSLTDLTRRAERGLLGEFSGQAWWRDLAVAGKSAESLGPLNAVTDTYLADYWDQYISAAYQNRLVPPARFANIALHRPATQSSTSEWSHGQSPEEDAAGAVNGIITGGYQFHTDLEPFPWWSIDLEQVWRVAEIRIFNRCDNPGCTERFSRFTVETSKNAQIWGQLYTKKDLRHVGGVDGQPFILVIQNPIEARYVRITLLGRNYLSLDQVEVYGYAEQTSVDPVQPECLAAHDVPEVQAGQLPSGSQSSRQRRSGYQPIIHVAQRGNVANRMIQFMAAKSLHSLMPDALLSGVELPEWGIVLPELPADRRRTVRARGPGMRIDREVLSSALRAHEATKVEIDTYAQHMDNFPSRELCNEMFVSDLKDIDTYPRDMLLISIRGGEIYNAPHPDYTLIPVEFYSEVLALTGLKPVFMGQLEDNSYTRRLRATFPEAKFVHSQGEMRDFETIRRAHNIVVSVSTFSWLAAWLSHAELIILPLSGFLNPAQCPEVDLLPLAEDRYRYYLFPINYAVPPEKLNLVHKTLVGQWRYMPADAINDLRQRRPRFGSGRDILLSSFDESYYLSRYPDLRGAIGEGGYESAFSHYSLSGYAEHRDPFPLDKIWYGTNYPLAALEVGQGDFLDFHHHFLAVGRDRGYLANPPLPDRSLE